MGLAILADGMGGYNAGEVASGMATTLLGTELEKELPEDRAAPAGGLRQAASHAVLEAEIARPTPRSTRRRKASRSTPAWARRWSWRCSTTT
jgi:serine/threonine protein phosphatase PrpC